MILFPQMSCVEEEIDRMSESFLQLSMQMQRRSQISTMLKERENGAAEKAVIRMIGDIFKILKIYMICTLLFKLNDALSHS